MLHMKAYAKLVQKMILIAFYVCYKYHINGVTWRTMLEARCRAYFKVRYILGVVVTSAFHLSFTGETDCGIFFKQNVIFFIINVVYSDYIASVPNITNALKNIRTVSK